MDRKNDILFYYCVTHTGFLHSCGEAATKLLLDKLDPQDDEKILEVGTGTGSTLIKIAARKKHVNLFGVEKSESMLNKTKSRLIFCGVFHRVKLSKIGEDYLFPFVDNFFDKIYIESVLAIQEDYQLETVISELSRILRPGGLLIMNETIWLPSISQKEIEEINKYCKEKFGVIQANGKYKFTNDWCSLLESYHIHIADVQTISASSEINKLKKVTEYLSDLFSSAGKLKGKLSRRLINEISTYKKDMNNIFEDKQYLQALLFTGIKNK